MTTKTETPEHIEAVRRLRDALPEGATLYCVLEKVSRSGMTRSITPYAIQCGEMLYLGGYVARVLGVRRQARGDGVVVRGCGMDMGFALMDDLRRAIGRKELHHHWL